MLESGYIRLYRSMLGWEWYTDTITKSVFLHLLLTANFEPARFQGETIERGQCVISYQKLADELRLSVQSVRTALKHLISTRELTYSKRPRYGIITISNYDKYQGLTQSLTPNQHETNTQLTSNQHATNNNIKKQESKKAIIEKEIDKEKDTPTHGQRLGKVVEYGEFKCVKLRDEEMERLAQRLGKGKSEQYIDKLDRYIASTGKKYKSHYATILNWARKDGEAKEKFKYDDSDEEGLSL